MKPFHTVGGPIDDLIAAAPVQPVFQPHPRAASTNGR
jgi:hypothetical protein